MVTKLFKKLFLLKKWGGEERGKDESEGMWQALDIFTSVRDLDTLNLSHRDKDSMATTHDPCCHG